MEKVLPKIKTLFRTGFFHIFGSSVINKIIAFMSSVVLVRILTKAEYGVFTYAWNIYSIILIFNGMGIESGVLQVSSEHSGDTEFGDRASNYGIRYGVKFDLILVAIILLIGLFAPLKIEASREILCMLCLLPMSQILFQMTTTYLRAQKRNQEFARLTVLNTALIFVVSAGCAFIFREKGLVFGYYAAYLSSFAVGFLIYHVRIFNNSESLEDRERKGLLKIAAISMVNSGLSQLMYLLDVFVLGIVDPQETLLASYKVATMIPSALAFIPLALITYLYPYFAEQRGDGNWCLKRYKQILLGLGGLNLVISGILFAGAPLIIRLLFGEQYLDAVPVFRILSVNYFFSGTFRILSGNLLVTQRKLKFNLFVAIVSSLTNVVADYFFIQWWGSIGAALATVLVVFVSSVLSTTYLIYTFRHNQKTSN
ncbi:lipopolysaccharide biosynthesis protein [Bacillota bacterium LCP21S3_D9]